jgi:uncharacterized SAM-binding protein YcdF (DUF218 family)
MGRITAGIALLLAILIVWAIVARQTAPVGNTTRNRFDAILVLGYPADSDGNPTPEQLARVTEAVREYGRGAAPRLILSGGAVANRFVEAESMARSARAMGVPSEAILVEPRARNTIENVCFAAQILRQQGWHSAEVISTAEHLPRAGMILSRSGLEWHTHMAPTLKPESAAHGTELEAVEVIKTLRYLVWARWADGCRP